MASRAAVQPVWRRFDGDGGHTGSTVMDLTGRVIGIDMMGRQVARSSRAMTGRAWCGTPARCGSPSDDRDYRPSAVFSAGTRSVFSHVKVPFVSSGSRPKWPYAEVGT